MSRPLDPEYLDERDVEYIRQRPLIQQEFILQGYGDPLDPGYSGLVANQSEDEDEDGNDEGASQESAPVNGDEGVKENPEESDGEDEEGDESGSELEAPEWNTEMTKSELSDVISTRNEGREEDDMIVPSGKNKDSLIAALEQDDESEDEDDEA